METTVKGKSETKKPDQVLGESIVKRLVDSGYLDEKDSKTFLSKLISGKIKESDWRVEFGAKLNTLKS